VRVESTAQMKDAIARCYNESQVLIMAAAPSDFKPHQTQKQKIKKDTVGNELTLELQKTPDVLKEMSINKGNRLLVGFALETGNGVENARRKLKDKNLDLIVLNHPGAGSAAGLGKEAIQGTLLSASGEQEALPEMSKQKFAGVLLDRIQQMLSS